MLIQKVTRGAGLHSGDMVFFTPPTALQEAVAAAGGSLRSSDLFVKRIAALPGDSVTVTPTGTPLVKQVYVCVLSKHCVSSTSSVLVAKYITLRLTVWFHCVAFAACTKSFESGYDLITLGP
jgi:Signal peptidase, peptidase S26